MLIEYEYWRYIRFVQTVYVVNGIVAVAVGGVMD